MKFHFNLFKTHSDVVGIAIGDAHIRALQFKGGLSAATVEGFAEAVLPKTIFDIDGKIDVEGLSRIFENLFLKPRYGKFTSRDVAVNLPEAKCFVRVIHVAPMSDSEIEAAVPFEAESYIPVPVDQVYLDWQRLEEVDGKVALLLVASPKEYVDQVLTAVRGANLTPVAVEVESQGLARALVPQDGAKQSVLIADMKGSGTDLIMIEHGNIQFTSSIPIGGVTITDAIAKGLEVPIKRAEEIKAQAGLGSTEEYPNLKTLLVPVMNSFVTEIKQVIAFHNQHSSETIGKIVLVGGSAGLKSLPEFLQESLDPSRSLLVELGDPTINVKVALPEGVSGTAVLPYSAAIGLAMRGLSI